MGVLVILAIYGVQASRPGHPSIHAERSMGVLVPPILVPPSSHLLVNAQRVT